MKKVLVTGSSGFIGRHAAAEFQRRGYEVVPVTSREIDLLDIEKTEALVRKIKPTHLAHFAWYGEHGKVWNSRENLRWVAASAELYRAFLDSGGQRAFFAGSCAEYDWSFETLGEQKTPCNPQSVYGRSKNVLRKLVQELAHRKSAAIVWGRIFFVYGPGEKEARLAPSILNPLLRNERAIVRCGDHVRDFLHVEDVARAAATLMDSQVDGVVNIASGNPIKLSEFGKLLARIAGRPDLLTIEHAAPTPDNPLNLVADVELLRSIGFVPKYSLEEGLKTLITT